MRKLYKELYKTYSTIFENAPICPIKVIDLLSKINTFS